MADVIAWADRHRKLNGLRYDHPIIAHTSPVLADALAHPFLRNRLHEHYIRVGA